MTRFRRDPSRGYDRHAGEFMGARNARIGPPKVRAWAATLPRGAEVLELGCGHGTVSAALLDAGVSLFAIDASPRLVAAFHERFPDVPVRCEPAETSLFFGRTFDAAIAWGLLFLLDAAAQRRLLRNVAAALRPGGELLFTAPREALSWRDGITGRRSRSLGAPAYASLLHACGLAVSFGDTDEGDNHYYRARKPA